MMPSDQEMISCEARELQLERLCAIMHRLRAPQGCPWDAEQTHESIIPNLIEEAYEVIDAIERQDMPHLKEELGDLLLQVVFHAEIAKEKGHFTIEDIARDISEKLIRRHPHVFQTQNGLSSEEVLKQWDEIKKKENLDSGKVQDEGSLSVVGKGLPALLAAVKLQKKAARFGFDWADEWGALDKLKEEVLELEQAMLEESEDSIVEEIGDVMFSAINLVRKKGLSPEHVLLRVNAKFKERFHAMERDLRQENLSLEQANIEQLEAAWQRQKKS